MTGTPTRDGRIDLGALKRLAQGREAEIYALDDARVLKLYWDAGQAAGAALEEAAMTAVRNAGGPAPASYGLTEADGRPGLIMERVSGVDLLTQFGSRPWTIVGGGRVLARAHAALHRTAAPDTLPPLRERISRRLHEPLVPQPARDRALRALELLPDGTTLCHMDFHPANVMRTKTGAAIIDWTNSCRGDAMADVARTIMTLRLGEVPPGSPFVIRTLASVGRRILLAQYQRTYGHEGTADWNRVDRWMLPITAARLAEGIAEERERTLALIGTLPG